MKIIYYLILLISINCFCQKIVDKNDIYEENGISLLKADKQPLQGQVEHKLNDGSLLFSEEFENGIRTKRTLYYKIPKVVEEKFFNQNGKVIKKIKYSSDSTKVWITIYEENGNKKLEEEYKEGKLFYHCEYLNNKKHGKVIGFDKKGNPTECVYDNGKFIK